MIVISSTLKPSSLSGKEWEQIKLNWQVSNHKKGYISWPPKTAQVFILASNSMHSVAWIILGLRQTDFLFACKLCFLLHRFWDKWTKAAGFFFFFFSRDQAFYKSFESLQFWARASKPLKGDIESKQKVMSWASLPLLRLENWSCSRCFKSSISFLHACQPQGGKNDSLCVVFLLVNQAEYLAPATLAPTQKCWKKSEKWSSFEDRFCVES